MPSAAAEKKTAQQYLPGQVLAGDFKQLGPVVRSPIAFDYTFSMPLMERVQQAITVGHPRVPSLGP